jgi:hypothetical protein
MGTAFAAAALPILAIGVSLTSSDAGTFGTSAILLVLGTAGIAIGVHGQRRATAWLGTFAVVVAIANVIIDLFGSSPAGTGVALTLVGLAIAGAAWRLDGRTAEAAPPSAGDPGAPAELGAAPGTGSASTF